LLHEVSDLFELNVKLRCQKVKILKFVHGSFFARFYYDALIWHSGWLGATTEGCSQGGGLPGCNTLSLRGCRVNASQSTKVVQEKNKSHTPT